MNSITMFFLTIVLTTVLIQIGNGLPYGRLEERIIGGHEAEEHEFPYQVTLYLGNNMSCGGAIIDSMWILTAAHCLPSSTDSFYVKAGKHDLSIKEEYEQVISVAQTFRHPKYPNANSVAPNDIALLKLKNHLQFNHAVAPVALPSVNSIPSGMSTVSGWGLISNIDGPVQTNLLQTVDVPIIDVHTCRSALQELNGLLDTPLADTNICTGPLTGGYATCRGDSGGPLTRTNQNGHVELIGLVSWGNRICGVPGAPSVYTRVSAFVNWIHGTMYRN